MDDEDGETQSTGHRIGNVGMKVDKPTKTKGIIGLKYTRANKTQVKGIRTGQLINKESKPRGEVKQEI